MAQATDLPSPFQMLQNPLQILHKIKYLERRASHGSSNRSANPFPTASNPLQTLDKSDDFGASSTSRLGKPIRRILYKSVVKIIILEPRTPHDSGRRSAKPFSNASNSSQVLYKTEYFGASGASWLKQPICQVLFKCFKPFTYLSQN